MTGLYFHVPFCAQACHYCDFHFSTSTKTMDSVLQAMRTEIEERAIGKALSTIYFGGGTPSILAPSKLAFLLKDLTVDTCEEATLEANPEDIEPYKLEAWSDLGIDRLSIGVQTFQEEALAKMNRVHNGDLALKALGLAKKSKIKHMSIDQIFGQPWASDQDLLDDLEKLMSFDPEHISAYALTIEERTVFGKWKASGSLKEASDHHHERQYQIVCETLAKFGYEHYEVSNWAKPQMHSKHNESYWKQKPYIGIGPSAHSFDGSSLRRWNLANNALYSKKVMEREVYFEQECLTKKDRINEHIMTQVRRRSGLSLAFIEQQLSDRALVEIDSFVAQGFVERLGDQLCITEKGFWYSDKMARSLFA